MSNPYLSSLREGRRFFVRRLVTGQWRLLLLGLSLAWISIPNPSGLRAQGSEVFTLQKPGAAVVSLVGHGEDWHLRKGTNPPPANWYSVSNNELDGSWRMAPGGFGFGDSGIAGEATTLTDMANQYSTFYTRRAFELTTPAGTNQVLVLRVDYDDGFVAYLDGAEVARQNLTNGLGTQVAYNATTGGVSHEASCCNNPVHPAIEINLGVAASILSTGLHVLAIQCVNQTRSSSDAHLIADLFLVDSGSAQNEPTPGDAWLWQEPSILLSGSNNLAGATRVAVNGDSAVFNLAQSFWEYDLSLRPGMNRLFIQALDPNGLIISNLQQDIVYQVSSLHVGGGLTGDHFWTNVGEVIHLTNSVIVASNASLTVGPGLVLLLDRNVELAATNGGRIEIAGTREQKVWLLRRDGLNNWSQITANGSNSLLTIRHADISGGQTTIYQGATGLFEDSFFHDFRQQGSGTTFNQPLVLGYYPQDMTVRRCRFRNYYETLWRDGSYLVEDCLFEDMSGDAFDFDGALPGSTLRRTTFRRGLVTNVDAVDVGNDGNNRSTGVLIDACLMRDYPYDKGVSIGEWSSDITVRNSLMYNCDKGVQIKDTSTAHIYGNTIVDCGIGLHGYEKTPASYPGGGIFTNTFNNILWNNSDAIVIETNSELRVEYCLTGGTNWSGPGNVDADPLFVDAPARDYRLGPGSPCLGTGKDGADMGAPQFVGGIPSAPALLSAAYPDTNRITLIWQDTSDNETGFVIERSTAGGVWQEIALALARQTLYVDGDLASDRDYAYRVCATNRSGLSEWSNPAAARTLPLAETVLVVGGALTSNTVWSGEVLVASNVTVPNGLELTVAAGTKVRLTNGVSIVAQAGGLVTVNGTDGNRVVFEPAQAGSSWSSIAASGAGAQLSMRQAELARGALNLSSQATAVIENVYVHDVGSAIVANSAASVTLRRVRVNNYSETIFNYTLTLVEDSLFENLTQPNSDAFELQGSPRGSVVRRCTFRNATGSNSDAVDFNGSSGVLVEDCLIYNISDKGISLGAAGTGGAADYDIVIRNCLIHHVDTGIAIKDGSTVTIQNTTVADSSYGLRLYQKYTTPVAGGLATNTFNNIVWGVNTAADLRNNSVLVANFSDFQGTNWPGQGNLSADPLFLDPAALDYRLSPGSPCSGTGSNGVDMGVICPVGGIPGIPAGFAASAVTASNLWLNWQAPTSFVSGIVLEISNDTNNWAFLSSLDSQSENYLADALDEHTAYFFRIRATNFIGSSFASEPLMVVTPYRDADQDGLPDAFEQANGLDPDDPADADRDADGDGMSNRNEYLAGTNPQNPQSLLKAVNPAGSAEGFNFEFGAAPGVAYTIQYRDSLTAGAWLDLRNVLPGEAEQPMAIQDPSATNSAVRFYRIAIPERP